MGQVHSNGHRRWRIQPEVPCRLGERTQLDGRSVPSTVMRLHVEFTGWLGDDIVETHPCVLVTERLAAAIERSGLSGAGFAPVEVTIDPQFERFLPDVAATMPTWRWMQLTRDPGADFSHDDRAVLTVSEAALALLRTFTIAHATVGG